MIPGEIAESLPVQPLAYVSPSRYGYLHTCALRELWLGAAQRALLPRGPAMILGTLAHQVLARASRAAAGRDSVATASLWNEAAIAIDNQLASSWLERSLCPLLRSARFYEIVRLRVLEQAAKIAASRRKTAAIPQPGFGFEVDVHSRDGLVRGRIDWVYGTSGAPVVADFKSGHVLEDPLAAAQKVKPEHELQLRLYAGLYAATYAQWPVRLEVIPLKGDRLVVPFTPAACEDLIVEAGRALRTLNDGIESLLASGAFEAAQRLGNPQPNLCRTCLYRPACPPYHQALAGQQSDAWPRDVIGVVDEVVPLRHGRMNVVVRSRSGGLFTLRAVSGSDRHPAVATLHAGDRVGIFNFQGPQGRTDAAEGRMTVIYKMVGRLAVS